ncbi:MAG: hypothetical protein LBT27_09935, partial [Prevotellaceae bacterium]|nr:hypothetical protein [Prevotellaceae bacterium]
MYSDTLLQLSKKTTDFDKSKFDDAMKFLPENGDINPEDLIKKQPLELLNEVNKILSKSITQGIADAKVKHEVPDETINALRENVFVFSGMKTYHELKEA